MRSYYGEYLMVFGVLCLFANGCATLAEQRKLEHQVGQVRREMGVGGDQRSRYAGLASQIEALRSELRRLEGRVEVAEHSAEQALQQAQIAREDTYQLDQAITDDKDVSTQDIAISASEEAEAVQTSLTAESGVEEYRLAYASWRAGDFQTCIDRFREFLQSFPSSEFSDDATYWMADCYFKQGDYKTAILRFDDVAGRYPTGNKAADALFRQGEGLLKLGPSYRTAASKAFRRVINEYPDSPRAKEAESQIELLELE